MSEATQLADIKNARCLPSRFILDHQLDCFALVAQNDSQDRFVADGERSAPRNDGDI